MGDPNCYNNAFLDNCYVCPNRNSTAFKGLLAGNRGCVVNVARHKRINRQSRMSSSMGLLKRRSMVVSKQIGQGAPMNAGENHPVGTIASFIQVGGPGDKWGSIQKSTPSRGACYNMGRLRNRTAYKNNSGVDRKHGSYQRYLSRRVGGVLRKEITIDHFITSKPVYMGQQRKRARGGLTQVVTACNNKGMTSGNRNLRATCTDSETGSTTRACTNRIPSEAALVVAGGGVNQNGWIQPDAPCNQPAYRALTSGDCGNPGVCVAGKCKCCSN
tara:strand:+ start:6512 stop:7327 length:816 start_codon:yes stop_codon:yes gene_type:complete